MSSLKQLSKIDERTKLKVYGWIRTAEKELRLNYIPTMISNICILYVRDEDFFEIIADNVKVSKKDKCLTKINCNGWNNCSFGSIEIPSKTDLIHQWDVKVIKLRSAFRIGVSSSTLTNINMVNKKEGDYYVIYSDKFKWYESGNLFIWDNHLPRFDVDDIVSIYLYLRDQDGKLSVAVNGGDKFVAYRDIKRGDSISYRFMVGFYYIDDCVEIVNFTKKS